jgi:type I restriction enzyme S subunit
MINMEQFSGIQEGARMLTLQQRVHCVRPPNDWCLNKLHLVLHVRKGFKNIGMQEENLLSLSYGKIIRKNIDASEGLLPESFETYQIVEPGNIVMRLTDLQNDKRSLRQGLVTERGIITSAYDALEVGKDQDPRFWAYALLALDLAKYYYSLGGGVRQSINFSDFPNEWIATPDVRTQKQIADFLDRETARIDLLIEKKQQLLLLLNQKIKNTISNAVVGSCKIINELQRKPIKLKYATEVISHKLPYAEIDAPYIGMEHIKSWSGEIEENHEAQPEGLVSLFKSGDILFGKLRPNLCKVALPYFDGVCSTELLVLRPNKNVLGSYLRLTLSEQSFIEGVVASTYGAKMPRASWEYIGSVKIDLPSIEHQHQIVDYLKTKIAQTESLSKSIEMSLQGLQELRSSLITSAVTGQLDIRAWQQRGKTERCLDHLEQSQQQRVAS